jgi:hypothetical protein
MASPAKSRCDQHLKLVAGRSIARPWSAFAGESKSRRGAVRSPVRAFSAPWLCWPDVFHPQHRSDLEAITGRASIQSIGKQFVPDIASGRHQTNAARLPLITVTATLVIEGRIYAAAPLLCMLSMLSIRDASIGQVASPARPSGGSAAARHECRPDREGRDRVGGVLTRL